MGYVAGVGIARRGHPEDMSLNELVFEAASAALADAGLTRRDIDGVCISASDQLDGRAISSMQLAAPAGGYMVDEVKVTDDGTAALVAAALRIEAGLSRHTLVVSWTKCSGPSAVAALGVNAEPVFTRPAGLHPLAVEAAVTGMFVHRNRVPLEAVDALARKLAGDRITTDQPVALPLRTIHIPPPTDAAVALVLSAELGEVELAGWAWGVDHPDPTRRNNGPIAAVAALTRQACQQAGVTISRSVPVETTDSTVFRLCMAVSGLGLAEPARAPQVLLEGVLPNVNRSGGLWESNPLVAAGLERLVKVSEFVRAGSESGIAHACYGTGGQGQFVAVLRRRARHR